MNIGTLEVKCDHIERVTPVSFSGTSFLEILLDDVDVDSLMSQLASMCDPEYLLEYFHTDSIREYLAKEKSKPLSPRDQYNALSDEFLSAKTVEVKL
jgi:hypothetical protein